MQLQKNDLYLHPIKNIIMVQQKINITENQLQNIVEDVVRTMFENTDMLRHGEYANHGDPINVGKYVELDTPNLFKQYADEMWSILQTSYQNIGGLKSYHSLKDFKNKGHLAHVILDDNGKILACETYRLMDDSFKIVCGGCVQNDLGKLALQQLIQYDIVNFDLHYWAEVSGHIEYYFKKYNGFPMPSSKAGEILNIPQSEIHELDDKVHYQRPIGVNGELYTKMIYGIKSKEIFNSVIADIENYGSFMKEVNTLNEDTQHYNLKQIIYIVDNIYRAHEEDGFNELIPSWYKALKDCLNTLRLMDKKNKVVVTYIKYCEYLLSEMPLLMLGTM